MSFVLVRVFRLLVEMRYSRVLLLCVLFFVAGFVVYPVYEHEAGVAVDMDRAPVSGDVLDYEAFEEVYRALQATYFEPESLDKSAMQTRALKSYVAALNAPYTTYLEQSEYDFLME